MANNNCLEGFKCPGKDCGQEDEFNIACTVLMTVTDDGTDDYRDVEWNDDSYCECPDCGFSGKVADFRSPDPDNKPVGAKP